MEYSFCSNVAHILEENLNRDGIFDSAGFGGGAEEGKHTAGTKLRPSINLSVEVSAADVLNFMTGIVRLTPSPR